MLVDELVVTEQSLVCSVNRQAIDGTRQRDPVTYKFQAREGSRDNEVDLYREFTPLGSVEFTKYHLLHAVVYRTGLALSQVWNSIAEIFGEKAADYCECCPETHTVSWDTLKQFPLGLLQSVLAVVNIVTGGAFHEEIFELIRDIDGEFSTPSCTHLGPQFTVDRQRGPLGTAPPFFYLNKEGVESWFKDDFASLMKDKV